MSRDMTAFRERVISEVDARLRTRPQEEWHHFVRFIAVDFNAIVSNGRSGR